MLIGRPSTVRPISTTRTRSLAASSAAVYSYSFTSLVNVAAFVSSHCVRRFSPGVPGSPNSGFVVPLTGAEYGCGAVLTLARTRHCSSSPGLNPASANAGDCWLTWRFGRQTPTTTPAPPRRRALDLVLRRPRHRVPAEGGEPVVLSYLESRDLLRVRCSRQQQDHARSPTEAAKRVLDLMTPLPSVRPAAVVPARRRRQAEVNFLMGCQGTATTLYPAIGRRTDQDFFALTARSSWALFIFERPLTPSLPPPRRAGRGSGPSRAVRERSPPRRPDEMSSLDVRVDVRPRRHGPAPC